MDKYPRSTNKANFGPIIEWSGGACPVPPGTPISVFFRCATNGGALPYWQAINKPENLHWDHRGDYRDVMAYYERIPAKVPRFGEDRGDEPTDRDFRLAYLSMAIRIFRGGDAMSVEQAFECAEAIREYAETGKLPRAPA